MNCARFETLLTDFMDGLLDARVRAAMDEHVRDCHACSDLVADVRLLRSDLAAFPEVEIPESLVDRVLDRTTGRPRRESLWRGYFLPAIQPFMTQRYALATIIMFVFVSLMVNLMGPEFSAFSYNRLRPAALVEEADRFSNQIYRKWMEFNSFKSRVGEEVRLLKEDLFGRMDYHLIRILFKSYTESVEEEKQKEAEVEPRPGDKQDE